MGGVSDQVDDLHRPVVPDESGQVGRGGVVGGGAGDGEFGGVVGQTVAAADGGRSISRAWAAWGKPARAGRAGPAGCGSLYGPGRVTYRLADLAEKAGHHPDIDIRYNRVRIALSTHDEGGITEKDTALAAQIDGVA